MDKDLWKIDRYLEFLEARKLLLASEANARFTELLHGDLRWIDTVGPSIAATQAAGGPTTEAEEAELEQLNHWVANQGLPRGHVTFDYADPITGQQQAAFDLAWPLGLQENLSQPVAVLLNETPETLAIANKAGYRYFTSVAEFKRYVLREILAQAA